MLDTNQQLTILILSSLKFVNVFIIKKLRVILEIIENAVTTHVGIPRTNNVKSRAFHKSQKFKIAKMWGLFINRENSNFAKF